MPKFCAMNTKEGFLHKPYAPSIQLAIDSGLEESLRREDGSNTVSSQKIVQEAQAYKEKAGINKRAPDKYQQLDENFAKQVAKAYEEMRHNPSDPETANAYQALITETLAQYEEIIANGLQVEFIPNGTLSPYEIPSQAVEDIVTNNHMWVYSTRDGHGQGESLADNPLLQETQHKISGQTALANDIFRVVHDYYGHAKNGIGFRAEGEENAFLSHSAMYTNPAQRALATETRGQNSWVNFGPYGAQNKNASESDTIFAPQKVGLLPEELSNPSYPYASDADAISETVEDMKNGSAFGETFNIDGSRYTGGGIGVAVISVNVNTKNLTPAMIRGKIKKFLKENRLSEKIGVFTLDDTDGKISSIDLTLIFPQEQKNLAIQLGSFTRQQSLWDFDNSELVYTGRNDTGLDHKNLTPTQLSAVRDAMARGELPSFVKPNSVQPAYQQQWNRDVYPKSNLKIPNKNRTRRKNTS